MSGMVGGAASSAAAPGSGSASIPTFARWSRHALLGTSEGWLATSERAAAGTPRRPAPRAAPRGWILVLALLGAAARIAAGGLWLGEGILKYHAGFGAADILLVANSTAGNSAAGNSRVPFYFHPLGALMQAVPALFGLAIPALEVGLGVLLVIGAGRVITTMAALGSIATLMLYWSSDQLIAQYPVLVLLSALVLVLPRSGWFGAAWVWGAMRSRGNARAS